VSDRAEERQEATLTALQELVEGQKAMREQIDAVTETLARLSHDQAMLVDALGNLRRAVLAHLDRPQTAGTPHMEEDQKAIREELSRLPASLMVSVDEVVGPLHRRLIALEERMARGPRP
jgi:hypothetical protein